MSAALLRPELLWLLPLAPLAGLALRAREGVRARTLRACVGPRVAELAEAPQRRRRRVRGVAFSAALLLGLVAALGPAYGAPRDALEWGGADLVVCLDVSRSMRARDEAPDRLARAQEEIRALGDRAKGDRLGLVVFAGEALLVVPLTRDAASFAELAGLAGPSSVVRGGTDLGAALDCAREALARGDERPRAVVLLTDGEDLAGQGARAAARCAEAGIAVHGLGLGTALGSKIAVGQGRAAAFLKDRAGADVVSALDRAGLTRVAEAGGGTFASAAGEAHPLLDLYERHVLPTARAQQAHAGAPRPRDRFQGPLLLAALLFLLDLWLVGRTRR